MLRERTMSSTESCGLSARRLLSIGLALLVLGAASLGCEPNAGGQRPVTPPPGYSAVFDLELPPVLYHSVAPARNRFDVTLKNDASGVVELGAIRTSCGCTEAALTNRALGPRESTELQLTIDSSNVNGQKTVTVVIDTKDGDPWLVRIKTTAYPIAAFDAMQTYLGKIDSLDNVSRTVSLHFHGPDETHVPRLTALETNSDAVRAIVDESSLSQVQPGVWRRTVDLTLDVDAGGEVGSHAVKVFANRGSDLEAIHEIIWHVESPFRINPKRVIVATGDHGDAVVDVSISRADAAEFSLSLAKPGPPFVSTELIDAKNRNQHFVRLTVDRSRAGGAAVHKLTFQTSDPSASELIIPLVIIP